MPFITFSSFKKRLAANVTVLTVAFAFNSFRVLSQTVPDTNFVYIPANPTFVFATDVTNATTGEASPINAPYCMGKYLVTNGQYKAFTDATSRKTPSYWKNGTYPTGKKDHPVLWVSLADVEAYCAWLGTRQTAWKFRPPTEAEVENAAAGPSKYKYPWGNNANTTYTSGVLKSPFNYNGVVSAYYLANFGAQLATYNNSNSPLYNTRAAINTIISISSTGGVNNWINHTDYTGFVYTDVFDTLTANGGFTSPVYAYPEGKSYYGCYDLAGNAYTWTSSLIIAQNGAETGLLCNAVRGGSWYATGNSCKTTYRGEGRKSSGGYATIGFRVVAQPLATSTQDVADERAKQLHLGQNFPNPFKSQTTIPFTLAYDSSVAIDVFDAQGKKIFTAQYKKLLKGEHQVPIDAQQGAWAQGIYTYQLTIKNENGVFNASKQLIKLF